MCECRPCVRNKMPNLSGVISNVNWKDIWFFYCEVGTSKQTDTEEDGEKPLPMSCQASLRYSSVSI